MWCFGVGAVEQRDGAGGVPDQVDDPQGGLTDGHLVTATHRSRDRHRDGAGVVGVRHRSRRGGRDHRGQCLHVVAVAVARHHRRKAAGTDEAQQRVGFVRGIDQELLACCGASQQVGVVVHRAYRDLGNGQSGQLPDVRRPADTHRAGVAVTVDLASHHPSLDVGCVGSIILRSETVGARP